MHESRREFYLQPALQNLPTPFYVYDFDGIRARVKTFLSAIPAQSHVHFAMKCNHNIEVLKLMRELNVGVDLVSSGEMLRAAEAGFTPDKMIFSGVGKTENEITAALQHNVHQLNVESVPELKRIAVIASKLNKVARIALRMNPDVDVKTHPYIRTGFRDNKFGLDFTEIQDIIGLLKENKSLQLRGLTLHIGSQIRDTEPFRQAIRKTLDLWLSLKAQSFELESFDVGGGLGIDYLSGDLTQDEATIKAYGAVLNEELSQKVPRIDLEPGRILVARFGALITEVQYVKRTPHKNFLIVDAGMNHLIRPALYEAHHRIVPLESKTGSTNLFDVVGPICESADVLGAERVLPQTTEAGERLAVLDAGAYGQVMASDYNLRDRAKEYILESGKVRGLN